VDDARIGRSLRVLRQRRALRQVDIARVAGISQAAVSLIERGHLRSLSLRAVRAAFEAVDAGFEGHVVWRGGELDRVLDEGHALLGGAATALLRPCAWQIAPEVTFSRYAERGSIDLLATRSDCSAVLVIELKTRLMSVEDTLRRLDVKLRLAPSIVFEREGWRPATAGRLLVFGATTTSRRRVRQFDDVLRSALPDRGRRVQGWLQDPRGPMNALVFLPFNNPGNARRRTGRRPGAESPESAPASVVIAR
jgi:transcriptional regulator with XRE-family HTH domain